MLGNWQLSWFLLDCSSVVFCWCCRGGCLLYSDCVLWLSPAPYIGFHESWFHEFPYCEIGNSYMLFLWVDSGCGEIAPGCLGDTGCLWNVLNDPVLLPISSGRGLLYQGHEALYSKDVTCRGLRWVSGDSDLWWNSTWVPGWHWVPLECSRMTLYFSRSILTHHSTDKCVFCT